MSLTLPTGDILETPPGYPFEEINYEDIEVEEVSALCFCCLVHTIKLCWCGREVGQYHHLWSGKFNSNCWFFRWWEEERLGSCAKPSGKAKMLQLRPSRANRSGKPSSLRYCLNRVFPHVSQKQSNKHSHAKGALHNARRINQKYFFLLSSAPAALASKSPQHCEAVRLLSQSGK